MASGPELTPVPVYAEVVPRTASGQPTNVTDVIYWMFYPYNNGKSVCIGWYVALGLRGRLLHLRQPRGRLGAHDRALRGWAPATGLPEPARQRADLRLRGQAACPRRAGTRRCSRRRARTGSTRMRRATSTRRCLNGDFLADDTGYGVAWDTWNNVVTVPVQPVGSYTGDLAWMNITAELGQPRERLRQPDGLLREQRRPWRAHHPLRVQPGVLHARVGRGRPPGIERMPGAAAPTLRRGRGPGPR